MVWHPFEPPGWADKGKSLRELLTAPSGRKPRNFCKTPSLGHSVTYADDLRPGETLRTRRRIRWSPRQPEHYSAARDAPVTRRVAKRIARREGRATGFPLRQTSTATLPIGWEQQART